MGDVICLLGYRLNKLEKENRKALGEYKDLFDFPHNPSGYIEIKPTKLTVEMFEEGVERMMNDFGRPNLGPRQYLSGMHQEMYDEIVENDRISRKRQHLQVVKSNRKEE
jgi:hypothetical protein